MFLCCNGLIFNNLVNPIYATGLKTSDGLKAPENIRKPRVLCFQEVYEETGGIKWGKIF